MARSLGTLTLDLIAKIGGFEAGLDKAGRVAKKKTNEINTDLGKLGKNIGVALGTAAAAGIVTVTTGLALMANQAIDTADSLNDLNKITGISVETLSRYAYAATQSGTSLESLQGALPKFAKNITEAAKGTEAQAAAFDSMGISVVDAQGKIRGIDSILADVATKFAGYEDGASKAALAQALFGKSGAELIPFLNNGAEGLANLAREADNFGATISGDTARAADEFNDNMAKLKTLMSGVANAVIVEILPALNDLTGQLDGTTDKTAGLREVAQALLYPFRVLAEVTAFLGNNFETMGINASAGIQALGQAITGDAVGALQTMKAAQQEVIANTEQTERQIAVIWGRTHSGMQAVATESLQGIGIQWQGVFAEVLRYNSEVAKVGTGIGAGTVLAPGVSGAAMQPKIAAPFTPKAPKKPKAAKEGKSEAEKQEEQLQDAMRNTAARLRENIALYSDQSNVAQIRYATEFGELSKLDQKQKDSLIAQAQALDELQQKKEAMAFLDSESDELDALRSRYEDQNAVVYEAFAQRQAIIEEALALGTATQAEADELTLANAVELANAQVEIAENAAASQREVDTMMLSSAGDFASNLMALMKATGNEQSALGRATFAAAQAIQVAMAIINANAAAASITAAYAAMAAMSGPAAPAVIATGLAQAEVVRALGYASAAVIGATALASFEGGGFTGSGSRTGGMDGKGGFMAMLHPNETVIDHTKSQGGARGEVRQTFNIQTKDADSFRASQRQIARQAKRGMATS